MNRIGKELKTVSGHSVVLRQYITGDEHREIRRIYMTGTDANRSAVDIEFDGDNKSFELAIISVDSKSDNVVKDVLALPLADFMEVVAEVKDLVEGKKKSVSS